MSALLAGPNCGRCASTEQRCAYVGGCCVLCTHWSEITAEPAPQRPSVSACAQSDTPKVHGTEDGYWTHRREHTEPCPPCKIAHLRYKGLVS